MNGGAYATASVTASGSVRERQRARGGAGWSGLRTWGVVAQVGPHIPLVLMCW